MLKVYLAGPEVFHPDAVAIGALKRSACLKHGFEGLYPVDNEIPEGERGPGVDRVIYRENLAMMRRADLGVFNLTPFRGVSADAGTVFELDAFVGMGKPVFGYSNDQRSMLERVGTGGGCRPVLPTGWVDSDGMVVEDYGNADNLMLAAVLTASGAEVVLGSAMRGEEFTDLSAFRLCLAEAARVTRAGR